MAVRGLTKWYGATPACDDVALDVHRGSIVGIVGESGSGKTTVLRLLAGLYRPDAGAIWYDPGHGEPYDLVPLPEPRRRALARTEIGLVHQNPRDGLRMHLTAGANIAERLIDAGERSYAVIRSTAQRWLDEVEIDRNLVDHLPEQFSGGMQQRLQLARVLVTSPRLLLMDEPTGGLDVSVQARLIDVIRSLVRRLRVTVLVVSHDIGVIRLLADSVLVMRAGRIVESGITDRVLDDPAHPYTQLLVSAALVP
jgi:putative phosphonate transport system ATP-binding protein